MTESWLYFSRLKEQDLMAVSLMIDTEMTGAKPMRLLRTWLLGCHPRETIVMEDQEPLVAPEDTGVRTSSGSDE